MKKKNPIPYDSSLTAKVFIAGADGNPVHVADVRIDAEPLLIEPSVLHEALMRATSYLTKRATRYAKGKEIN